MMIQLVSLSCFLALVIAGLLVMTRVVTLEKVSEAFVQVLIIAAVVLATVCTLKTLWCVVLLPGLLSILSALKWAVLITALGIIVMLVAVALIHRRRNQYVKNSSTRGEL